MYCALSTLYLLLDLQRFLCDMTITLITAISADR